VQTRESSSVGGAEQFELHRGDGPKNDKREFSVGTNTEKRAKGSRAGKRLRSLKLLRPRQASFCEGRRGKVAGEESIADTRRGVPPCKNSNKTETLEKDTTEKAGGGIVKEW